MNKKTRSEIGKANRNKGKNLERVVAKGFRDIGYNFCKTSRHSSRLIDSCKIDLDFIPYNVQCKSGYEKSRPKPEEVFREMSTLMKEHLPPEYPQHKYEKIIIHAITGHKFAYINYSFLMELLRIKKLHDEARH